jgi:hypothetical protein
MKDTLAGFAREHAAIHVRLARLGAVLARINPAQLSPVAREQYTLRMAALREQRQRLAELRRRLVEMRRRERSSAVAPLVPRCMLRRVAAKARRRARRQIAARARNAARGDPAPHRKRKDPTGGTPGGPKPSLGITDAPENTRCRAAVNRSAPWRR